MKIKERIFSPPEYQMQKIRLAKKILAELNFINQNLSTIITLLKKQK